MGRSCPFACGPATGRNRRISLVAGRPGAGPLTEPIAATQPRRRQPLLMPHCPPSREGGCNPIRPHREWLRKTENFLTCAGKRSGKPSAILTKGCLVLPIDVVIRQEFTTVFRDVNWVTSSRTGATGGNTISPICPSVGFGWKCVIPQPARNMMHGLESSHSPPEARDTRYRVFQAMPLAGRRVEEYPL